MAVSLAWYASQLANYLTATGKLSASTGLDGITPYANGGTGANTLAGAKANLGVDDKQDELTLTTTGSSGPATLSGSTLNIPSYSFSYTLQPATASTIGGVKPSTGLSVAADGGLSVTSAPALDNPNGFGIKQSGGKLYLTYNNTNIGSWDSTGNYIAAGDATAKGTA